MAVEHDVVDTPEHHMVSLRQADHEDPQQRPAVETERSTTGVLDERASTIESYLGRLFGNLGRLELHPGLGIHDGERSTLHPPERRPQRLMTGHDLEERLSQNVDVEFSAYLHGCVHVVERVAWRQLVHEPQAILQ